jgi:hypothetical protein
MSDSFEERRRRAEEHWAHDNELKFKVTARRDRLLGEWAAGELGLEGPEMEAYAKTVVDANFDKGGENDVLKKIRGDFDAAKLAHSDHVIRAQMEALSKVASEQFVSEKRK